MTRSEQEPAARDLNAMATALRGKVPGGEKITGIIQLSAGTSSDTYLVQGLDVILRPANAGLSLVFCAHDVVTQYEILREVDRAGGVPAPKPIFFDDGGMLGEPFYLMERLAGTPWGDWEAPAWVSEASEAVRARASEDAIAAVSALHREPPIVALGSVRSPREELARWRNSIEHDRAEPMGEAFALLDATAPVPAKASIVHGDSKLSNMMWAKGRLTGLIDWEMSFNGDPRWDIAYILMPFGSPEHESFKGFDLPGLWQRSRMIKEWEIRSGRKAERIYWFEAACFAKIAAIVARGHHLWKTGQSSDERFASYGEHARTMSDIALTLARIDAALIETNDGGTR